MYSYKCRLYFSHVHVFRPTQAYARPELYLIPHKALWLACGGALYYVKWKVSWLTRFRIVYTFRTTPLLVLVCQYCWYRLLQCKVCMIIYMYIYITCTMYHLALLSTFFPFVLIVCCAWGTRHAIHVPYEPYSAVVVWAVSLITGIVRWAMNQLHTYIYIAHVAT